MSQREALAYGDPTDGGIVLGGFNAGLYDLLTWDKDDNLESRTVVCSWQMHNTTTANFTTRKDAAFRALGGQRGNLGLTAGTDRTIAADVVTAGQLTTLTRTAGDLFASTDVGLPLHLTTSANVSIQVTRFISTSSVECRIVAGFTAPPTESGITATIGDVIIRCVDQDGASTPEPLKVGGLSARSRVGRDLDTEDDEDRRLFSFSVVFERPAAETRLETDKAHRQNSKVSKIIMESGLAQVTFSGTVTAGMDSGTPATAIGILTTAINGWIAGELTAISSGTFELIGSRPDFYDDEHNILIFSRTYREMNFPDLATATNDPRITGANVMMSRQYQNIHGLSSGRQPYIVNLQYSASVTASTTAYTEIDALWAKTIKPYLAGRIKAIFGGAVVITGGSDPVIDPVSSRVSASIVCLISKSGSNVYAYSRTTTMNLDERFSIDDLWDGKDFTHILWTAGRALTGSVEVKVVQLGEPERLRKGISALFGGGIQFNGGSISLGVPGANILQSGASAGGSPSQTVKDSGSSYTTFPQPGEPSRFFPGVSGGKWITLSRAANETPTFWGNDPDGVGNKVQVTTTAYKSSYIYCAKGTKYDPAVPRVPTQKLKKGARTTRARDPRAN
jgi:hypothetical protein